MRALPGLSLLLPAALAIATIAPASSASNEIKIALLAPTSGTAAAAGHDMINAWNLYWQQHGDTVAGKKIVTTTYDTGSNPAQALDQARHAVEEDGAQIIIGPYLANEGLAVAPYGEAHHIPMIEPTVSADDLSQRQANTWLVKVAGWTSSQPTHVAGVWAAEQHYKTVATLANAYAFGYENAGGFAQTFTEHGGKIVAQLWAPLGTTDYSPYISRLQASHPDAVFVEMVGADAVHFLQQWSAFGLKGKIPLIANETTTDQSNIRNISPQLVDGILSFGHYADGRADPATRQFVLSYGAAEGVLPSYMAASFYTAAQWLSTALERVHGHIADSARLLTAIHDVRLSDSPFGPMELDRYNDPVENIYLRRVVATSGPAGKYAKTWNVVVKTWPHVSQFWTYDPKTYLKQPVYTRTFQGIKE